MVMETLTICRLLERILHKEFHKVQDVVKKKTKAVENYRPSRHCRIGFKSKVSDVFSSYVLRYLVDKYFMYFV